MEVESPLTTALKALASSAWIDGGPYMIRIMENSNSDSPFIIIIRIAQNRYTISGTGIMMETHRDCPSEERIKFLTKFPATIIEVRNGPTQSSLGVSNYMSM